MLFRTSMKNIYFKILFLYSLAIFSNVEATSKGLISLEDLRTVAQEDLNNPLFRQEGFREFLENSVNVHSQEKIIVSLGAQKLESSKMIQVVLKLEYDNNSLWNSPQTREPIVYEEYLGNFSESELRRASGLMGLFEIPEFVIEPVLNFKAKVFPNLKFNLKEKLPGIFNKGVFHSKGHMNFIQFWLMASYIGSGNPLGFVTDQVDFTNFPHQVIASENLVRFVNYFLGALYFYSMQMSRSHLKGNTLADNFLMNVLTATGGLLPGPHLILEMLRRRISVKEMLAGHKVSKNPLNILDIAGNLLPQTSVAVNTERETAQSHNVKLVFKEGEYLLTVDSETVAFPIGKEELNDFQLYSKLGASLRVASFVFGQDKKNPSGGNADIQSLTNFILSTGLFATKQWQTEGLSLGLILAPIHGYVGFYQAIFEKSNLMYAYIPYALTKAGYSIQAAKDAQRGKGFYEFLTHFSAGALPPVNTFFEMVARYARMKVLMSEQGINLSEQSLKLLMEEGITKELNEVQMLTFLLNLIWRL